MKKKIIPRGKYILVKPEGISDKPNEHGLSLPANMEKEQKAQGEVIAVSSEIKDVKIGDVIIFGVFAGETMKVEENGKKIEYKLLHNDDVIAFVK